MKHTSTLAHSKWFGHMGHLGGPVQKGIVTYQISSYEQRAFANLFKNGLFNMTRRIGSQLVYVVPAILLFYSVYSWGNSRHVYINSKEGKAALGPE